MATIIENRPGDRERVVEVRSTEGGAGWSVAVIVLIAVIGGLIWWFYNRAPAPAAENAGGTNINVTVPPLTPSEGGENESSNQ